MGAGTYRRVGIGWWVPEWEVPTTGMGLGSQAFSGWLWVGPTLPGYLACQTACAFPATGSRQSLPDNTAATCRES